MILEQFKLDGKIALVTGASRGLGRCIAMALAEAGADVALTASGSCAGTAASIRGLGRRALEINADLLQADAVSRILDSLMKEWGGIDILVNNAGIIRRAALLEFTERDWDDVIQVNQKSLFFLSQAVARQMVAQGRGGKIINIASLLSYQGGIRVPSYTAAKSAVLGLTRIMANEWAPHGINVNAIAPGYMETDNTTALRQDAKRNADILARIPAGRWGRPEDLQGAVVFLASAASHYLHGAALAVDGGWLAR
ncbi:MAG TPA: 2-dehydro-3-deoxy-D-gluconate 5-dehydrogenase KduD [Verrucomicrobiae bacterium]|nr:2-dehydro-3-deoxy-D-gluconate 5-dehydrogenase KduD [Verrucomicrobiae bacterium]